MSGHDSSLLSVVVAVAVNTIVTIAKYIGFFMTRSPAMLAEAIHSTADVGNQVLLWIGLSQSGREADEAHPYGFGEARYLWNLKSAMGIFFLGCGVTCFHGVHALYEATQGHHEMEDTGYLGIGILIMSLVLEGFSLVIAVVGINKDRGDIPLMTFMFEGDDPTGVGVVLEDGAAVFGVILALIGVSLSKAYHSPYPDAIATILIGILLGVIAVFLAKQNGDLLIGRAVSTSIAETIKVALEQDEAVAKVEDLKATILGQGKVRVKAEIELEEQMLVARMRDQLKQDLKRIEGEGEDSMKVLCEVVSRSVRTAGAEIQRLDKVVRTVAPSAIHVDLELF